LSAFAGAVERVRGGALARQPAIGTIEASPMQSLAGRPLERGKQSLARCSVSAAIRGRMPVLIQAAVGRNAASHLLWMLTGERRRSTVVAVQEIDDYFAAWNEPLSEPRRSLLERSVSEDVELIHPTWGRSQGIDALMERIEGYMSALPDSTVVLSSGLDSHNGVIRYGWEIVDPHGQRVMEGLDVVELAEDGRLRRVILFHGPLPAV